MTTFDDMMSDVATTQARYGVNLDDLTSAELAAYWRMNLFAAVDEISEVAACLSWKPWVGREGDMADVDSAVLEITDVLRFVLNIAWSLKISPTDLDHAWKRVQKKITTRQEDGYDQR